MLSYQSSFGALFKRFRLRSGFASLHEFGDALSEKGFPYEDSLFSHWQKNSRIPKDRKLLLALVDIFIERGGVSSVRNANIFLESARQGNLTEKELDDLTQKSPDRFTGLNSSPKKILEFLTSTAKSKRLIRAGWIREKVKNPESVAEHSFQLSVMAMIFADHFGVDKEKLIKMAVLHDLGEVITGDVVWTRGSTVDLEKRMKKEADELRGIKKIFSIINLADEYRGIFEEMVERRTLEAKVFWELDKLEMAFQALLYEKEQHINLGEFYVTTKVNIHTPFLKKIFKQILKERPKFK